ncbi:MAG: response regulator [Sulfuricurvum sp.]|jgi:CheY-like chemotaxis protein|uniref:response regulator n=1 Tax=Sulfuricurvum sp. TaxID=2025608 RepID=UPI0025F008B0|nr:response regulator [Sulfuricurvum sp.]MCK9373957.1 response regulator [Sulfuricurvum sp.]
MEHLKLLIVDDVEDNRLVLKAICRKVEGFEIQEACDGIEAVEHVEQWHPHIILMDIMMPRMDGFEASKIIKERYPSTIILAVTAVIDPQMEEHMASIGVAAYIRKPIDKELIRFKLKSFGEIFRSKTGEHKKLSKKKALNPFCSDIRHFRTLFDITDEEAMMDFGVWVLSKFEPRSFHTSAKVDIAIELCYALMHQGGRTAHAMNIVIEENFEEFFITLTLEKEIELVPKLATLLRDFGSGCIVEGNKAHLRLSMLNEGKSPLGKVPPVQKVVSAAPAVSPAKPAMTVPEPAVELSESPQKEVRTLDSDEQGILRQSFITKTSSREYVQDIGGDVLDEISELASLDEEWTLKLTVLETDPTVQNIQNFADGVLGVYVHAINNLFEFTALAYALSALGSFLKAQSEVIIADAEKLRMLVLLMEHLGKDLTSWREHIFILQDSGDIHYMDSSFFSSCMQIEGIISNKEIASEDDNDMEFF